MRLLSYRRENRPSIAVRKGDAVVDIQMLAPEYPRDIVELLALRPGVFDEIDKAASAYAGATLQIADRDLLPIVPRPGKILCLGLNYADHAREGDMAVPENPVVFLRVASSLLAPSDSCVVSALSEQLDYEAELAVVMGCRARDVTRGEALSYVAGYSIFNDLTYRDYQFGGPQWTLGKNFDGTGALGAELVTSDELPSGADGLQIRTRVNGVLVQDGNTADMIFKLPTIIEYLSRTMTLEPGDVIITGTPAGVGRSRKPPLWLKHGDVCEVEIEQIGKLTTSVVSAHASRKMG